MGTFSFRDGYLPLFLNNGLKQLINFSHILLPIWMMKLDGRGTGKVASLPQKLLMIGCHLEMLGLIFNIFGKLKSPTRSKFSCGYLNKMQF